MRIAADIVKEAVNRKRKMQKENIFLTKNVCEHLLFDVPSSEISETIGSVGNSIFLSSRIVDRILFLFDESVQ